MLKKLAKFFPILFFVMSLGLAVSITKNPQTVFSSRECSNHWVCGDIRDECDDRCNAVWLPNVEGCGDEGGSACLPPDDHDECIEERESGTSQGADTTYIFYCNQLSCTMDDGVFALRCDNSNSFAVKQWSGSITDPCHGLEEYGGYRWIDDDRTKACECAAYQLDWMKGGDLIGWSMGNPQQTECIVEDTPDPPSANFSAVCYPAEQEYNDLSYRFSLNNITGSGEFQQATLFLSFNNNSQTTEQEDAIKGFLGAPTWVSGSWYGYWLDRQFSMSGQSLNFRTWDEQLIVGGDKGNQKTIDDLVNQTQTWIQQGVFPENHQYLVEASVTFNYNGAINKTDSVGGRRISVLPDACAEPPPAPQCTNVQMLPSYPPSSTPITDFSTLETGQQVNFLCEATPANSNQIFKYRVIRVNDNDPSKGQIVENFNDGYGIGNSGSFEIPDSGKYFAQCVTCDQVSDFEYNCAEWEPIPDITVQDVHGGPAPIGGNDTTEDRETVNETTDGFSW